MPTIRIEPDYVLFRLKYPCYQCRNTSDVVAFGAYNIAVYFDEDDGAAPPFWDAMRSHRLPKPLHNLEADTPKEIIEAIQRLHPNFKLAAKRGVFCNFCTRCESLFSEFLLHEDGEYFSGTHDSEPSAGVPFETLRLTRAFELQADLIL